MYFGSRNQDATLVLKQEEESEKLKVVREDEVFDFKKGYWNAASCVSKNEIFSFKALNYEEVFRYSLESGKWSLYFRK